MADGRVYTDSLTPVLHRFILTRFSLQRYHRRLGDLMVGLGGDPYMETVASSTLASLKLTLFVKTIGRSGGGLENRCLYSELIDAATR